jgi:hypothetical protein
MLKYFNLIVLTLCFCGLISSQNHLLIHNNDFTKNKINLAAKSNYKFHFSTNPINIDINTYGINLKNTFNTSNGITTILQNKILGELNTNNPIHSDIEINTFSMAINKGDYTLSFGHSFRLQDNLSFSKELFDLYLNGNEGYIGKSLTLPLSFQSQRIQQFVAGVSKNIGKFRLGLHAKYLNGANHFSSKNSSIKLITQVENFNIKIENDLQINSSGYSTSTTQNLADFDPIDFKPIFNFSNNHGFAVDLGAEYNINEQSLLFLSMQDLGSISWKNNVNIFSNQKIIEFKGINIKDIIDGKSINSLSDSLKNSFDLDVLNTSNFSSNLNSRLNLGAIHKINNVTFSGVFSSTRLPFNNYRSLSLQSSMTFAKIFTTGLSYTYSSGNSNNIGALVAFKLGPANLYVASQNILKLAATKNIDLVNINAGLSLNFGVEK